jgi:hypothetical protein
MASGVIIADCPICRELVWEDDDFTVFGKSIKHKACVLNENIQSLSRKILRLSEQNRVILTEVLNVLLLSQEKEE